ncbi:conserved hypothetical protein [Theileria equi strain WA]|uniref:Uncharacterized protein n=1 Tax=Theileria equi strain WA TaxID=1537102 RepID=L1LBX8_THEEQ|nr:conserved hypothetical protein [Theileria equi strain WA]EKX72683.1 conserved hypothetical protein [Theileria equi strain WA]|eukprot:XP_004832135.1 conserved hypothetical protein [Theileria equi strain WA]
MDSSIDKKLCRIDSEISGNKCYESMQHILSLVKRNLLRNKYKESLEILYNYASIFIEKKEFILAGELMDEYAKVADKGKLFCNIKVINNIISIFESPWTSAAFSSTSNDQKMDDYSVTMLLYIKFMNRAISFSKSETHPHGNPLFHKSIGRYYIHEKDYVKAQGNLVYSQDVELLLSMINEWKKHASEDEHDFFYLRAILMLVACGDICNAKCFIYLLDVNLEDPEVPLPIQLAHLLTEACDPPDEKLFEKICHVYQPILDLDPEYKALVKTIRDSYFGHDTGGGLFSGLGGGLSALMRSFM